MMEGLYKSKQHGLCCLHAQIPVFHLPTSTSARLPQGGLPGDTQYQCPVTLPVAWS